jgi:hypothetical protein
MEAQEAVPAWNVRSRGAMQPFCIGLVTFTEHTRTRIVAGHTEEARPEGIVRGIEWLSVTSREKRRHRKTHGRISFGDFAQTVSGILPELLPISGRKLILNEKLFWINIMPR